MATLRGEERRGEERRGGPLLTRILKALLAGILGFSNEPSLFIYVAIALVVFRLF